MLGTVVLAVGLWLIAYLFAELVALPRLRSWFRFPRLAERKDVVSEVPSTPQTGPSPSYPWPAGIFSKGAPQTQPGVYSKSDEELASDESVDVREKARWTGPGY